MARDVPEKDWKYLRSIFDERLERLSRRINDEVRAVLDQKDTGETEKRARVFEVMNRGNKVVAECFDNWRRSTIIERCWALDKHGLLEASDVEKLDAKTKEWIRPTDTWRDRR